MDKCKMPDKAYPIPADIGTDRAGERLGRGQLGIELWVEVAQHVVFQLCSIFAILSTVVAVKVVLSTSFPFQGLCGLLNYLRFLNYLCGCTWDISPGPRGRRCGLLFLLLMFL